MYRFTVFLFLLTFGTTGQAQNIKTPPDVPPQPAKDTVDCSAIEGLSVAIKRTLTKTALCRLDADSLECLPGLTLVKDIHENRDLCKTPDGRFIGAPKCHSRRRKLYRQRLIRRDDYVVERPEQPPEVNTVDIPFTTTGRYEILAQTEPLVRRGPDLCVYLGRSPLIHDQRRKGNLTPKASNAKP